MSFQNLLLKIKSMNKLTLFGYIVIFLFIIGIIIGAIIFFISKSVQSDCNWNSWSPWDPSCKCVSPGGKPGTQTRTRTKTCVTPTQIEIQTKDCPMKHCRVNCHWNEWEPPQFGNCDCNTKNKNKTRTFTPEQYGGTPCKPTDDSGACQDPAILSSDGKTCILKCSGTDLCNQDPPCNIDCKWGEWSDWKKCNKVCKSPGQPGGVKTKTREIKQQKCGSGNECPLTWDDCSTCLYGSSCVNGKCTSNGNDCDTGYFSSCTDGSECNNGKCEDGSDCIIDGTKCILPCNTQACPIDCTWNNWEDWQECSVECGGGTKIKTRTSNPQQSGGKQCNTTQKCNKDGSECCDGILSSDGKTCTVECNTQKCMPVDCKGNFLGWFDPNDPTKVCSEGCGDCSGDCKGKSCCSNCCSADCNLGGDDPGHQCHKYHITQPAKYGGKSCDHTEGEQQCEDCCIQLCDCIQSPPAGLGCTTSGTWVNGVFKKAICSTSTKNQWECLPACPEKPPNPLNCDLTEYGGCSAETNYQWKCLPNTGDICGLTPKPEKCKDSAICWDSPDQGWRWYCQSDLTRDDIKFLMQWTDVNYADTDKPISIHKIMCQQLSTVTGKDPITGTQRRECNIPVTPTIGETCTDQNATYDDLGQGIINIVNNPSGNLVQGKDSLIFQPGPKEDTGVPVPDPICDNIKGDFGYETRAYYLESKADLKNGHALKKYCERKTPKCDKNTVCKDFKCYCGDILCSSPFLCAPTSKQKCVDPSDFWWPNDCSYDQDRDVVICPEYNIILGDSGLYYGYNIDDGIEKCLDKQDGVCGWNANKACGFSVYNPKNKPGIFGSSCDTAPTEKNIMGPFKSSPSRMKKTGEEGEVSIIYHPEL